MKQPRNKDVSARTDQETYNWLKKIADDEGRTFSSVVHMGFQKLKANFKPEEITKQD